jgi:flagellar basal-body rod protein FlgG
LFEITMPDGTHAYTRDGAFRIASDGHLVTTDGFPLQCGFQTVLPGTHSITISPRGKAMFSSAQGVTSFQLQLCKFADPAGLEAIGHNLYRETSASGQPELGTPGENGFGDLAQGFLELSNVKVAEELVDLIRLQRAYEVYSKASELRSKLNTQVSLPDSLYTGK